jgi:pyruvate formate lyase activating enzyme
MNTLKEAKYYEKLSDSMVKCTLCPRYCVIGDGKSGFCRVRENKGGRLFLTNYGLSTYMVVEPIETNGVFHFRPGARTLSIGSVGCNLGCKFCQAWKYTRSFDKSTYFETYSPEEIVRYAKSLKLDIISWTFNDPISWFEFVYDTAKLAKENGIVSLFKSSHYLNEQPLVDILPYIDVFSVSIKSIRDDFYRRLCDGSVMPVTHAAEVIKDHGGYLEISNLVVPTQNNSDTDFTMLVSWIKEHIGTEVPLHFARFHPDYLLMNVPRTPIADVDRAIRIARNHGLQHVYSGNVFMHPGLNTYCPSCHKLIVERKGECITIKNVDPAMCDSCGTDLHIVSMKRQESRSRSIEHVWNPEIWAIHVQIENDCDQTTTVILHHKFSTAHQVNHPEYEAITVLPRTNMRYTVSMIDECHQKTLIVYDDPLKVRVFDNLDRAYYEVE